MDVIFGLVAYLVTRQLLLALLAGLGAGYVVLGLRVRRLEAEIRWEPLQLPPTEFRP